MRPYPATPVTAVAFVALALAAVTGCQNSGFSGSGDKAARAPGKNADGKPGRPGEGGPSGGDAGDGPGGADDGGLGNTTPGATDAPGADEDLAGPADPLTTDDADVGRPDGNGLLIDDGGVPCFKRPPALHVFFAVDSTASMDDEIDAVRDHIVQFAAGAKSLGLAGTTGKITDVKIGGLSYVDVPGDNQTVPLTDPQSFQGAIAGWDSRGGIHDHCEGGLQAAAIGLKTLGDAAAAASGAAVSVLVVVSDNWSHDGNGGDGARTFDDAYARTAVQTSSLKHLLLFDSTPRDTASPPRLSSCPSAPTGAPPTAQWERIRSAWSASHPKVTIAPGGNVGFPFTQGTILTQITEELRRRVKVCK